ncbi:4862_t:CDS:2 [Rhizophagus irregularis]|nr:4862_t:CDS:2 [Rhizophagus irregularis]
MDKKINLYTFEQDKDLLGKNSEEWLRDFQKNVIANQINFAPDADEIAGRAKIDLLFELYLEELAITEIGKVGVEIATGVNLISTSTFNEDWSIAGKKLTVNVSVALNAGEELLTVTIAPVFGQLAQGSMLIEQFVNHIKRIENITKTLVETEKFILIQKQADTLSSFSIAQPSIIQPGHYTDTDIKKLVEE